MPPVIKTTPAQRGSLLQFALLLGGLLTVMFIKSFLPDYVHFSNDGPLAVQMSQCFRLPAGFLGVWGDLNWLGFNYSRMPFEFTSLISLLCGPVGYAKFLAPIALFIFGMCCFIFLRRLKLSFTACTLAALAATLNTTFFGSATWGVASQSIGFGMDYLALAMVVSNTAATPRWLRFIRLMLAGFGVGLGVIEGADNGAIFSMFVAAFVLFYALMEEGTTWMKILRGIGRVCIVALFAGLIATQTVIGLIGTQVQGMAGMGQDTESKEQHWDWATQWSTPKMETLGWIIPGLFGYRMDTPKDMPEWLRGSYEGGNYWGRMGRDLAWYKYFDGTGERPNPDRQFIRFTSGANYMGILVTIIALWAVAQSFRKKDSVFSIRQKRFIWFWSGASLLALLLAFGRFAPFYRILYAMPYFSTMRNPCKFTAIMSWALVIVFGYGIDALCRRYAQPASGTTLSPFEAVRSWWKQGRGGFDRKWFIGCVVFIGLSLLGWLIYANSKDQLIDYLGKVQLGGDIAKQIASFSIRQVGWFILLLILCVTVLLFVFSGAFSGKRARWASIFLGAVLLLDMVRANLPYIVHWNYKEKYASNSIIDKLHVKGYENRVESIGEPSLPFPTVPQMELYASVYKIEWVQQLFPYYDIQTMDIVQMPRAPEVYLAFEGALRPQNNAETYRMGRRLELTSTRYVLGPQVLSFPVPDETGVARNQNIRTLDFLNGMLDPGKARFRLAASFEIVAKPGIERPGQYEELTATENPAADQAWPPLLPEFPKGRYALYEFTGALPRAKLFNQWVVTTNDPYVLETLASKDFDPHQTVFVAPPFDKTSTATGTNQDPGTVTITSYKPAKIELAAEATSDSILLLNDRYDPEWKVFVDGKQTSPLRCNFLMRGVAVPAGKHSIELLFRPSMKPAYVTISMMALGIILSGVMLFSERKFPNDESPIASTKETSRAKT